MVTMIEIKKHSIVVLRRNERSGTELDERDRLEAEKVQVLSKPTRS